MKIDPNGNFKACLDAIAERGNLGNKEALDLLEQVAEHAEQMRKTGSIDPFVDAAHELAGRLRDAAKEDRIDALRNVTVRTRILQDIAAAGGVKPAPSTVIGRAVGIEGRMTQAEFRLRTMLHGMNAGDGNSNIESLWKGVASRLQGVLSWRLKKLGVEEAARTGAMDRDIADAMWKLNAGEAVGESVPEQVAKAVKPMLDYLRDRLNAAGARIGEAVDYAATTMHDPIKMRRAAGSGAAIDDAYKAWRDKTLPLLNAEKTFADVGADPAAREKFLRSVYDALVTGVHMTFGGRDEGGYIAPAFEGSRNLARKLSQGRTLFWKDGAAWNDYMQGFGRPPTLLAGIMRSLDQGARHLSLLENLGTNPKANFNQIVRRIEEEYRGDPDQLKRFQDAVPKLEAVVAHLDGSANIPASQHGAALAQSVRTWETVSDLGGVGLTHFASIWPTVTSEMVHRGYAGAGGRLYVLGQMIKNLVRGKGSAERQEILADLGAYAHGLSREMFHRWQAEDMLPGRISSIANTFMKYTGIHYVFDQTQAGIRSMSAHYLGRHADDAFGDLEPHVQNMLAKYGIGEKEWDQLRSTAAQMPVADGMRFLTPDMAMKIPGLKEAEQWHLADRLAAYYNDAAAHGVVTPGVRERAAVIGQERPGSLGGELRRFLFQFKMWPIAAAHQILGRDIWNSLSNRDMAWNLGVLLALTVPAGYLRMAVNDIALGNEPRNPLDPRTLLAAMAQGGGLGIYGDFLFGEHSRVGSGLVGTLGGPVVSDLDTLISMFNQFRTDAAAENPHQKGRFSDIWPELAHFGVRHMPFANYVYLKGALDYLLWYHLYEAANPGWWERANRRMMHEQGRVMAGYTPGAGVPYTPWAIGHPTYQVATAH